jgi:hypothetical protein
MMTYADMGWDKIVIERIIRLHPGKYNIGSANSIHFGDKSITTLDFNGECE